MIGLRMAKDWLIDRKPSKDPYASIPVDDPTLMHARTLIPPEWWPNTWVAGSAATRFGQHGDVDVWITGVPRDRDLSTILGGPSQLAETDEEYEHIAIKVYNQDGLQIMACHDPIQHLLSTFDISVHCGAMHLTTGEQLRGGGYAEQVLICRYIQEKPILTLTRYLTFAKRYQDFHGLFSENVQQCAAQTFLLKTRAQMEQELQDNYVDRGL